VRSGSDFFVKIDQRLSFQNRSAIFILQSDPDFQILIAITIPIKKPIRINQDPVFVSRSDREFSG